MGYDLKIVGGRIIDGTGKPAYEGDVGIKDGKVVALGKAPEASDATINAGGRIVAPGFVDIHTHYDAQINWDPMLSISPWHGVTTVVMGNCGFGIAPTRKEHRDLIVRTLENVEGMSVKSLEAGLGADWSFETFTEYLDSVEKGGSSINVAALLGHTPLRLYVMGPESTERAATDEEVARMKDIMREGLEAGALGFATSKSPTHVGYEGRPVPSRMAEFSEIRDIASALGEQKAGIIQATVGRDLSFDEFAELNKISGRNVSWTALLGGGGVLNVGSMEEQLTRSAELVKNGYAVFPQVTCRPLNFEFRFDQPFLFQSMPAFAPVNKADHAGKLKLYADADFREAFRAAVQGGMRAAWEKTVVSFCSNMPDYEERLVSEIAKEKGVDSLDLALDLSLESDLTTRFRIPVANSNEDDIAILLKDPTTVLGLSDAGAHASQLCDACFSTHLLGHWVREKKVLSLEEAVRMLTSRPAEVFGIKDRGKLEKGAPADVVVFDPDTVGASALRRVHDLPAGEDRLIADAIGVTAVVVNGTLIRENGTDMLSAGDKLPGRLLRNGMAA
ncbi:MAG: amidohydrolase family protein [Rhodobiaceae bacterium]|jgi:N-acyl-D-aspartate/D-glutamate deacylase|nr:amidohydrolase [Parvibaculum sp.]MCE8000562.1 amidohydrolase family protein [Rhodobiaceae bacterium]